MKTYQLMAFLLQYARMLSGKAGVDIKIAGNNAKTDGKTVFVPLLLDVKDALLLKVLYVGYIVHEVCHVLWTDFEVFRSASSQKRPFLNIFEDVAIEKKMGEWLPGCRQSLMELVKKLFETDRFGNPAEATTVNASLQAYCLYGLRSKVLGQTVLAGYADVAAKSLISQLPQGSLGKIDAVIDGVASSQSTAERLVIVDELFKLLEEIEDQTEQQQSNDTSNSDSEGEGDQSDADKPSESDGGDQGPSGDDESEKENSEAGQGGDTQSDENGDSVEGSNPAGPEADNDDDLKESEPDQQLGGKGSLTEVDDSFQTELGDLAHDAMSREILETADDRDDVPFDLVNIKRFPHQQSSEAIHRVKAVTNGLVFKMRSLVEAQTFCRQSLRDQGPRIDRKSIHRVVSGDMRVFKHEKKATGVNTAVYLMVDTSGSMSQKMDVARDTLLSMALALEQVPDVQVAAGRYPSVNKDAENNYSFGVEELVAFGERVSTRSGVIENMYAKGGTPTAEVLIHVAAELSKTKADRKICFLLTDGEPDNSTFLRRVIRDVEAEIEVIAIGIQTDAVKLFFNRYAIVNRIEDLPGECFKQLQQTLLKAA